MTEVDRHTGELAALWQWWAESIHSGYSPLYQAIGRSVARDGELLALVQESPPEAHLPLVLMAAVHDVLLGGLDHPLADVYAGRSDADPVPLFRDLCLSRRPEILGLMAHRRVQTNEVGRCLLLGPALASVAGTMGRPLHLVDVGSSAGLNLCCDRYLLDYGPAGRTGPPDAAVHLRCDVRSGTPPVEEWLGPFGSRVGIDLHPPDLRDPDDARWLLACVWPGTDRLERARAAIEGAKADPPRVVRGDAVEVLPAVLEAIAPDGVVCVLTTWSYSYFSIDQRREFVRLLEAAGERRPVAWIAGDAAGVLGPPGLLGPGEDDVLALTVFDGGRAEPTLLARVHPHGFWMEWLASG